MNWTERQRIAIETPGNLIVSAAAGAGKTAVLTERLCRAVEFGVPVENLLVLTFTRAAAAEMKGRIAKRLRTAAENTEDAALSARLLSEAAAVPRASISTIDAFSARLIKKYGHRIGIPSRLRILDEPERAALAAETRDALLLSLAEEQSEKLSTLLYAFGSQRAAFEAMAQVSAFLDAQPYPEAWLADAIRQYRSDAYLSGVLSAVAEAAKGALSLSLDNLRAARNSVPAEWQSVLSLLDEDLSRLSAIRVLKGYESCRDAFFDVSFSPLRFPRATPDAEKAVVRAAREAVKDCVQAQKALLTRTESEERALLSRSGDVLNALSEITLRFREMFAAEKRKRGAADYPDLGHLALELLDDEAVAAECRAQYAFIAVDEYQDTNRVNEAILERIRRPDNLFLVGDVKQSIYGFRQAEPTLFLDKLSSFTGPAGARADLVENFRSGKNVISAVNATFSALMHRESGELDYDERARLIPGAALPEGVAELHVLERGFDEENDSLESALDAEVEARFVAERIRALLNTETYFDPALGRTRPLTYADCAVLMRGMNNALSFARALSKCGVPAYAEATGGYFDAVEVLLMESLLSVIDNARQDVPLVAVMRSDLFSFTDAELAAYRAAHRCGCFYECVRAAANTDQKAAAFLEKLAAWRRDASLFSVSRLISRLYDETGFLLLAASSAGGAARERNLSSLIERAEAFERTGGSGLFAFLTFLSNVKNNASIGAAQTLEANVVRILSMHKSKGLEFPVVFLAGLGTRFNAKSETADLLLSGGGGAALRFFDRTLGVRADTSARKLLAMRLHSAHLSEEMRILYVAMTRARHALVMTGCARNAISTAETLLAAAATPARVLSCSSMLSWLMLCGRSGFSTSFHVREAFLARGEEAPPSPLPPPDNALLAALSALFDAPYPIAQPFSAPAKTSVTANTDSKEAVADDPFEASSAPSAAARGSATHALLSSLPLTAKSQLDVQRASLRLPQALSALADARAVYRFVCSPLFARMQAAPKIERELPFSVALPAELLFPGTPGETLVQGVIDCCFLEDGAWTLMDYKTDFIPRGADAAMFAEKHFAQVTLYARALERLTGVPVAAAYVVLLSAGAAVPCHTEAPALYF